MAWRETSATRPRKETLSGLFRQRVRVIFDEGGLLFGERGKILDADAVIVEEAFHAAGIAEQQVPLDDQAVKAGQNPGDFVSVTLHKRLHGDLTFSAVCGKTILRKEDADSISFWMRRSSLRNLTATQY